MAPSADEVIVECMRYQRGMRALLLAGCFGSLAACSAGFTRTSTGTRETPREETDLGLPEQEGRCTPPLLQHALLTLEGHATQAYKLAAVAYLYRVFGEEQVTTRCPLSDSKYSRIADGVIRLHLS